MTPYYSRDGLILYHGDCAEVEVECDLIITDPPYGQDFKSNRADNWDRIIGDTDIPGTETRLLHVLKKLRPFRHAYIFGDRFNLSLLPLGGNTEIIWDKGIIGSGDLSSPWGPQHEKITFAVHVPSKANRARGDGKLAARLRKGSVVRSDRANSRGVKNHPTEKPVSILRQFIESSSVFGDVVYDPFAGSGSTLVAAILEGRSAIGCEIDERYCETAVRRFERELIYPDHITRLEADKETVATGWESDLGSQ